MGTFGTLEPSEESSDVRLLELPAPVNPGILGMLGDKFE
jgi:hypothetical protein